MMRCCSVRGCADFHISSKRADAFCDCSLYCGAARSLRVLICIAALESPFAVHLVSTCTW